MCRIHTRQCLSSIKCVFLIYPRFCLIQIYWFGLGNLDWERDELLAEHDSFLYWPEWESLASLVRYLLLSKSWGPKSGSWLPEFQEPFLNRHWMGIVTSDTLSSIRYQELASASWYIRITQLSVAIDDLMNWIDCDLLYNLITFDLPAGNWT